MAGAVELPSASGYTPMVADKHGAHSAPADKSDPLSPPPEAAEDTASSSTVAPLIAAVCVWFIVGMLTYTQMPWGPDGSRYTAIDTFYLLMQILTTVGYGDIAPHADLGRVFTAVYVLSTVLLMSTIISEIVDRLMQANKSNTQNLVKAAEHAETATQKSFMTEYKDLVQGVALFLGVQIVGIMFLVLDPGEHQDRLGKTYDPGLPISDAVYITVITMTTVGFGDVVPKSQGGRAFMAVWMFAGVSATANLVGVITDTLLKAKGQMRIQKLSSNLIAEIDEGGDGEVSEAEFLCFMLRKYDLVDQDLLNDFRANFKQLDADNSGHLTIDDLKVAQQKATEARRQTVMSPGP
jgi:voltage-gated potassium channel Kch